MRRENRYAALMGIVILSICLLVSLLSMLDEDSEVKASNKLSGQIGKIPLLKSSTEEELENPSGEDDGGYVVFVGNTVVDLRWTNYFGRIGFKILRDEVEIAFLGPDVTFYRDEGAPAGTHTYQLIELIEGGSEYANPLVEVTLGEVVGTIYQDLTWKEGTYTFKDRVFVESGATLTIQPGVHVVARSSDGSKYGLDGSGVIQIEGATIEMDYLSLFTPNDYLIRSIVHETNLGLYADTVVDGNSFTNSSVNTWLTARPVLNNNVFDKTRIDLNYQSYATVTNNFLDGVGSKINVGSDNGAMISNNTFMNCENYGAVWLNSTGSVMIRGNRFRCLRTEYWTYAIFVQSANTSGVIENNIFEGSGVYNGPEGIRFEGGAVETIRGNVFSNMTSGVILNYGGSAEIAENKFQENYTGVYVGQTGGDEGLSKNCFAGNIIGLEVDPNREQIFNARGNWWGDPSGPSHPDNSDGKGDVIEGKVDFSNWIQSSNEVDCGVTDLSFFGMEVVQVVQTLTNTVPLVASKPTAVRLYPDSGVGTVNNVAIELKGYREGVRLGTLSVGSFTVNPVRDINYVRAYEKAMVSLPADWLTGTLTLVATIDPEITFDEISYLNNTITRTLSFEERNPLRLAFVLIDYKPSSSVGGVPAPEGIPGLPAFMKRIYPLAKIQGNIIMTLDWPYEMKGAFDFMEDYRAEKLLEKLTQILNEFNARRPPEKRYDQVYGVFVDGSLGFCISDPMWGDGSGVAAYCDTDKEDLAHEIGHNLGLRHPNTTDSCGAEDDDTDWPYKDATIQEYGWNADTGNVISRYYHDVMDYCDKQWIAPFHYKKLFSANSTPQTSVAVIQAEQNYLLASGQVNKDNTVEWMPFWQLTMASEPTNPPAGMDYCLEQRDGSETKLTSRCFDLSFYNFETYRQTDADIFSVYLPLDANTASVVLMKGAQELSRMTVSDHAPTVVLDSPNGGEMLSESVELRWTGNDQDGDDLTYNLYYSPDDGVSWQPVAVDITETSYILDLSLLAGSSHGRMRIKASDGFLTASDDTDGTITVSDKAPWVGISYPEDGAGVSSTWLSLEGFGYDLEDGQLDGSSLVWESDLDGMLGKGDQLIGLALSVGEHEITLTATDSDGRKANATVRVVVEEEVTGLTASNNSPTPMGSATQLSAKIEIGTNVSYAWDFGDGKNGSDNPVTHVYPNMGTYTAVVTASNSLGSLTASTIVSITEGSADIYLPLITSGAP